MRSAKTASRPSAGPKGAGMAVLMLLLLLTGCARYRLEAPPFPAETGEAIVVVPLANATTTPYAGRSAQAMVAALLQEKGFRVLLPPDSDRLPPPVGAPKILPEKAVSWARSQGARYLLGGTVVEWRYKVGLEGMPTAALVLVLYELRGERLVPVWQATLSGIGHGRMGLGLLVQNLLESLL